MSGTKGIAAPWQAPAPGSAPVLAQARDENFPVALRVLPRARRRDLMALYGFARLVDDIGDEAFGDRLAALDAVELDLARAFEGGAEHPLLRALTPTLRAHQLPRQPFLDLIEANRLDQRVSRTRTWDDLLAYCALSANPVGRLVLGVFDASAPARDALSDSICAALQVIEHCQDVAEDCGRGRVYLPQEDLERFGCGEAELTKAPASPALRRTVALQVERSRALLARGEPLLAELRGLARIAVAGFAAGGHATCDAIEGADFDVTSRTIRGRRRDRFAWMARLLVRAWRAA